MERSILYEQIFACLFTSTRFFGDSRHGLYMLKTKKGIVARVCNKSLIRRALVSSFLLDMGDIKTFKDYRHDFFEGVVSDLDEIKQCEIIVNFVIEKYLPSIK